MFGGAFVIIDALRTLKRGVALNQRASSVLRNRRRRFHSFRSLDDLLIQSLIRWIGLKLFHQFRKSWLSLRVRVTRQDHQTSDLCE